MSRSSSSSVNIITEVRDNGEYVGIHAYIDDYGRSALGTVMTTMAIYNGHYPTTARLVAAIARELTAVHHMYVLPFVEGNRRDAITYPGAASVPDENSTHVTLTIDTTRKVVAIYDDVTDDLTEVEWPETGTASDTTEEIEEIISATIRRHRKDR